MKQTLERVDEKSDKIRLQTMIKGTRKLGLFWLYPMLVGLMQCFGGSGC
jgi:hypothetical protein